MIWRLKAQCHALNHHNRTDQAQPAYEIDQLRSSIDTTTNN